MTPTKTPLRIGIDGRFLTHPQTGGFKTYTQSLIAALSEIDSENEYRIYVDRPPNVPLQLSRNFSVVAVPGTFPLVGMAWREQVMLVRRIAADGLDVYHAPCLTAPMRLPCPLVVTLHDLIWRGSVRINLPQPSFKHRMFDWYYRQVAERAARRAALVITVSEAAKSSIVQDMGLDPARVRVTYEAAAPRFRVIAHAEAEAAVESRFGLAPPFVLALGAADPRKNLITLLRAYAGLDASLRQRCPLAIVWSSRSLAEAVEAEARSSGIQKNVQYLTNVGNEDLVFLYNTCRVFAFPSRYEGFGLPLLEAMACGAPVVSADNSSLPEIAGEAAVLVDAEDAAGWTHALTQMLTDERYALQMREQGLARAAQFSWRRCAAETLAVYREAAQASK